MVICGVRIEYDCPREVASRVPSGTFIVSFSFVYLGLFQVNHHIIGRKSLERLGVKEGLTSIRRKWNIV